MAYAITSEDMIGICLIIADYNADVSMRKVLNRVEAFQQSKSSYFGVSEHDFRSAFLWLAIELRWFDLQGPREHYEALFKNNPLKKWILPTLKRFESVYFNDEGEHWEKPCEDNEESYFRDQALKEPDVRERSILLEYAIYQEKLREISYRRRRIMERFFKRPENHDPKRIENLLHHLGWEKGTLKKFLSCSVCEIAYGEDALLSCGSDETIYWKHPVTHSFQSYYPCP